MALSKPHLVVEVTQKRTTKHRLLCQEVLDAIKTKKMTITQSKTMMKQLMITHKVPLAVSGTYLNISLILRYIYTYICLYSYIYIYIYVYMSI